LSVIPPTASLYDIQTADRNWTGLNATAMCRLNPTLVMGLGIRLGTRLDKKELVAMLELRAHGVPRDLSLDAVRAWHDSAHQAT